MEEGRDFQLFKIKKILQYSEEEEESFQLLG